MEKGNIALIGFRATGKSLVGKLLAQKLRMTFVDMDDILVQSLGQSIDSWVRTYGWQAFRAAESELLGRLSKEKAIVAATGGGVVLSDTNRELLKQHFLVVWLQASPETIMARIEQDPRSTSYRPSLTNLPLREEIEQLLKERYRFYQQVAAHSVSTEGRSAANIIAEIEKLWGYYDAPAQRGQSSTPSVA